MTKYVFLDKSKLISLQAFPSVLSPIDDIEITIDLFKRVREMLQSEVA